MEAMTTLDNLVTSIASVMHKWYDGSDDRIERAQVDVGPEPGVILVTFANGEEFTIIVKEG